MKTRLFTLSTLAVAAIAFIGCNKIENSADTPEIKGVPFEFTATNVETKTTNSGVSTLWAEGDKVNLFHAVAGSTSYVSDDAFTASGAGASVTFSGTLAEELTAANYDWYAIYPYTSQIVTPANTSKGYVTVGSAANGSQTQTGNDSKAHLAGSKYPVAGKVTGVAKDTKPSISFSHLTSVIAVHVTNGTLAPITVSEVSFTGTEDIVGTYYINFAGSPVVYTASGPTYVSSTAILNVTSGSAIDPGDDATFYLAIKPFTASSGATLTLSVTADNGEQERDKLLKADATFAAGTINTLNFTYDKAASSIVEPTSETGWYRVEKADWLNPGDRVIIANHDGTKAMSKSFKNNNRDGVDVSVAASDDYTVLTNNDNVQTFILEDGTSSGSFAFWADNGDDASKYMYAASSSSNYLKFQMNLDANASFVATIINGLGNLTAQGANSHKVVQWNNLFACYASATYNDISLYKYYGSWSGPTTCDDPVISQEGNTVTISCTTPGVKIYYTLDGTDPSSSSTLYSVPFELAASATVKAIAVRPHYTGSNVVSRACTVTVATPVILPGGTNFTISCATAGATIYYEVSTVNMAAVTIPTTSSATYSAPVAIAATTYVKAIAIKDGFADSSVAEATCTYSSGTPNTYTSTFSSSSWGTAAGSDFSWASVKAGAGFSNNGVQVTNNDSYNGANANTNKTFTGVSQVVVTYNTNKSAGAGTLELKVGANAAHEENWAYSSGDGRSANYTCTFTISPSESGVINLKANTTTNSIYIVSVAVTAMNMSD